VSSGFWRQHIFANRIWHDAVALERAVYYAPDSWSTHYNLGLAYLGVDQYQPAQTELLEAKRLDPTKANVYNNLALAQAGLGHIDEALTNLKAALALDPRLLEAHNNLGRLLCDKGECAAAKLELTLVLEKDPASSSAHFNLARTLASIGDHLGQFASTRCCSQQSRMMSRRVINSD
jgi:Tfp pilus assembly protein PilF